MFIVAAGAVAWSAWGPSGAVQAQVDVGPPPWNVDVNGQAFTFDRCLGFGSVTELSEYVESGSTGPIFGRFIGKTSPSTIVCERDASNDPALRQWRAFVASGSTPSQTFRDAVFTRAAFDGQPAFSFFAANAAPLELTLIQDEQGHLTDVVTFAADEIVTNP